MSRQAAHNGQNSGRGELLDEVARTLLANPEAADAAIRKAVLRWWRRRCGGTDTELTEAQVAQLRRELGLPPPTPPWKQRELFSNEPD